MHYQIEAAVMEVKEMNAMERRGKLALRVVLIGAAWFLLTRCAASPLSPPCAAQVSQAGPGQWAVVTTIGDVAEGHIGFYGSEKEAKQAALEFWGRRVRIASEGGVLMSEAIARSVLASIEKESKDTL